MTTDHPEPLAQKIATWLPFVLPVLGGGVGITYVNMSAHANPFIWIAIGVVVGRVLAHFAVKPLEALADKQRSSE